MTATGRSMAILVRTNHLAWCSSHNAPTFCGLSYKCGLKSTGSMVRSKQTTHYGPVFRIIPDNPLPPLSRGHSLSATWRCTEQLYLLEHWKQLPVPRRVFGTSWKLINESYKLHFKYMWDLIGKNVSLFNNQFNVLVHKS